MKRLSQHVLSEKLSQLIDGALSEPETKELEAYCAAHPAAQEELQQLRRLKTLLAEKKKIEPNPAFWTRLSLHLEEKKKNEFNLLPFPRKYVPAISALSAAALVAVGVLVVQKRMAIVDYAAQTSRLMQNAAGKNILQGGLIPFFSKVNKDQALQFSLMGTLPLDEKSETSLNVDENAKSGYRIEVGKTVKKKTNPVTLKQFLAEVKPTQEQTRVIDSLLELAGKRIESSVLVGDNNAVAIDPALPGLNRAMVTSIAASLGPLQRVRMENLMANNEAPYTIVNKKQTARINPEHIYKRIAEARRCQRFVIITPDTTMYSDVQMNFDSLQHVLEENMTEMQDRRDQLIRMFVMHGFHQRQPFTMDSAPSAEDANVVRVDVNAQEAVPQMGDPLQILIEPRVRIRSMTIPRQTMEVHSGGNDAVKNK